MKQQQEAGHTPTRRNTVGRVTDAAANITGKRFCAHHQGEVPTENGSFVQRGKVNRWICHACQEKGKKT